MSGFSPPEGNVKLNGRLSETQRKVAGDLQSLLKKFYDSSSNSAFVLGETPISLIEPTFGFEEVWGALESMLGKIAEFYEDQVDNAVAGLTSLIEPVLIVFLGVVIGFVVISMFMPLFKMIDAIEG